MKFPDFSINFLTGGALDLSSWADSFSAHICVTYYASVFIVFLLVLWSSARQLSIEKVLFVTKTSSNGGNSLGSIEYMSPLTDYRYNMSYIVAVRLCTQNTLLIGSWYVSQLPIELCDCTLKNRRRRPSAVRSFLRYCAMNFALWYTFLKPGIQYILVFSNLQNESNNWSSSFPFSTIASWSPVCEFTGRRIRIPSSRIKFIDISLLNVMHFVGSNASKRDEFGLKDRHRLHDG